ncbi:MAG: acyltransferase [Bacteroidetes bacterium]|nr:acyltransferase [Bacteroidota bacterium]
MAYRPQLDGLRFIAVLGVLFYHYSGWLRTLKLPFTVEMGTFISFFFVLSSYLITSILLTKKHEGRSSTHTAYNFLARRTLRIFPAYYFYLILLLLLPYAGHDVREHPLTYFLYLSNFHTYFGQIWDNLTSHLWTLAVEEQFYIAWLWLILVVKDKYLPPLLYSIIAAGILFRVSYFLLNPAAPEETVPLVILTPACMDSFAFGALLAYQHYYKKTSVPFIKKIYPLLLALWVILIVTHQRLILLGIDRVFAALGTMILIEGADRGYTNKFGAFLQHKMITWLGKISYGLYLYHLLIPFIFWKIYLRYAASSPFLTDLANILANPALSFILYFLLTVGFASLSWRFLEHPISRLKKYFNYGDKKFLLK